MNPKPFKISNGRPRSFTDDEIDETLEQLISYGHKREALRMDNGSVWVQIPYTKAMLQVRHNEIVFHGTWDDNAIRAALRHAQVAWNGKITVQGSDDFKIRVWAHCFHAGIEIGNYHPPTEQHQEARDLIGQIGVSNFNLRNRLGESATLDDDGRRPWIYKNREPTPAERRYMESVERASGLGRSNVVPTI